MIHLTRLNGQGFVLNPDLILKAEATPDTVVTLVDGTKYVVAEPIDVLTERVVRFRASVVAVARDLGRVDDEDSDDPDEVPDDAGPTAPLLHLRRP